MAAERGVRRRPPGGVRASAPASTGASATSIAAATVATASPPSSTSRPRRQEQPGRAGAEVGHGQDAAGEVVDAEEAGRPARPLCDRLARRRDPEEQEAGAQSAFSPSGAAGASAGAAKANSSATSAAQSGSSASSTAGAVACGRELIAVTGEPAGHDREVGEVRPPNMPSCVATNE